jgi:hypothetical protein
MSHNPPEGQVTLLELACTAARLNADRMALLGLALSIANHVGLRDLDGLPVQKWYERQRLVEMERFLIQIEDVNPALAAVLQQEIDALKNPPA